MAAAGEASPSSCPCPQCGFAVPLASDADALLRQARQQILALESQVALLDQKAAAAIDRWADYEDELTALRRKLSSAGAGSAVASTSTSTSTSTDTAGNPPLTPASPTRTTFLPAGAASRLSALLSPRPAKSTPNLKAAAAATAAAPPLPSLPPPSPSQPSQQPPPPQTLLQSSKPQSTAGMPTPPPSATTTRDAHDSTATSPAPRTPYGPFPFFGGKTPSAAQLPSQPEAHAVPSTKELLDALTREQTLRRQAEGRLQDTSREVEELSVSLFEQANEMVAEERRARARLEARVAVLEQRDTDKKRRLERLEQAMDRIERLRAMLGAVDGGSDRTNPARSDAASLHEKQKLPMTTAIA
ncbi:hypothetical protein HMPREF1624_00383 [Sporothrix schenckii ATCC 58251]|uniref:GDP/GTP exchange factor Sec2 N-terminal domain-containing protein n=1 Tax=Sporothrix schenckii (strain ATCC 58251 / de Perez 2211183) TaxID=1391915 RepID=U7Q5U5_SPOS1|nr:hypothetical protein HMPREF1624_00383 [Sporothrix schenckii ATCC 58251]